MSPDDGLIQLTLPSMAHGEMVIEVKQWNRNLVKITI